jgi:hypothetical protein
MNRLYLLLPLIFAIGYFFGQWTCGRKAKKGSGFLVTLFTFILLNLIHSVVDGTLLRSLSLDIYSIGIIGGHEIIRQPLLYFFYFTATAPFTRPLWQKTLAGIFAVTGIWILGIGIGSRLTIHLRYLPDHEIAFCTYAFFGGDIFHHCMDYIRHRNGIGTNNTSSYH